MKFNCASSDLISALQIAIRALSVRSPQPILEGVLLETVDNGLQLTASDGTMTIITRLDADVEVEGACVMPGRLFHEVVRKMPDGEVNAILSRAFVMTLKCCGSRTNIAGQSADAYPRMEAIGETSAVTLPQNMIKDMIQRTSFAVPVEDPRPVLMGGCFNLKNGQIDMVGLDGFRMAMRTSRVSDLDSVIKAIIPLKSLEEIAKLMSDDENAMVTLNFSKNQMMVELGRTTFHTSLIDGEFIDYRRVLPVSFSTEILVSREEFSRCVDRASLMAREGKNNLIKFSIKGDKMFITSNSEVGDVFEELDINNRGGEIVIAFNVKYLLEIIRVISGEEIALKFGTPVSPCIIAPADGDDFTYLVLPVRINA